ncbi:CrcB family protein [Bacillus carboniphilus]|uniref:Fluoride-specific ion channel FluC n=1 Tax=Bacillus carboniphilus TaxID=86663 RepID=A0ABY9K009_9BACI|nr:CrcB family protein [Bacillus carboniphilus]WLR43190.1 CrcB family protein [Bacillus carboniphilus]
MIKKYLYVGLGGMGGALFRYATYSLFPTMYPTLIVNVIGSFLLGLLTFLFTFRWKDEKLKLFFGTGFCGSFTTMSTFAGEIVNGHAIVYGVITTILGIGFAFVGYMLGQTLIRKERVNG